jgi:hypothetical protein
MSPLSSCRSGDGRLGPLHAAMFLRDAPRAGKFFKDLNAAVLAIDDVGQLDDEADQVALDLRRGRFRRPADRMRWMKHPQQFAANMRIVERRIGFGGTINIGRINGAHLRLSAGR